MCPTQQHREVYTDRRRQAVHTEASAGDSAYKDYSPGHGVNMYRQWQTSTHQRPAWTPPVSLAWAVEHVTHYCGSPAVHKLSRLPQYQQISSPIDPYNNASRHSPRPHPPTPNGVTGGADPPPPTGRSTVWSAEPGISYRPVNLNLGWTSARTERMQATDAGLQMMAGRRPTRR